MSAGTATPTPIASTKYMLANLLQRERIEVKVRARAFPSHQYMRAAPRCRLRNQVPV